MIPSIILLVGLAMTIMGGMTILIYWGDNEPGDKPKTQVGIRIALVGIVLLGVFIFT